MIINDELINKLAHLSRLEFDEEEKEVLRNEIEKMIGFFDKLNELDTTGVEPLLHLSENRNIFRKDKIEGQVSRAEALKNAPVHDEQFFKVPKVIRK